MQPSDDPPIISYDAGARTASVRAERARRWSIAALIAITVVALWPVLTAQFVNWDDVDMVLLNRQLNPPTTATVAMFWREPYMELYVPLTYTLYAAVAEVSVLFTNSLFNPHFFHVTSLLLHIVATTLAWLILRRLIDSPWAAWIGAAVFAAHPIQTEAVAWVASLNTVLAGMLSLAAIWCYVESAARLRRRWYVAATTLFALALLAKPSAVVVPLLVLAIELMLLRRPARRWWKRVAVWLVMAAAFAIIARNAQAARFAPREPLANRIVVAADAGGFYLSKLLLPFHFAIDYGRRPEVVLQGITTLPYILVLAATIAAAWAWRRFDAAIPAGVAIFLVALLPVLGLVPFQFQNYSTVADRYAYSGMLGAAVLAAALARRSDAVRNVMLAVVALLVLSTMRQAFTWHDTYSLAGQALRVNPRSVAAHNVLAGTYVNAGDVPRADAHYRAALEIRPDDPQLNYNYGNLLLRLRRPAEALKHLEHANAFQPNDKRILQNLGVALAMTGHYVEAERALLEATQLAPDDAELQENLGSVESQLHPTTAPTTGPT